MPIGAVVVVDGQVVARRHNERELTGDPTAHAEVLALRDAAAAVGSWRLDGRHAGRHARAVRDVRRRAWSTPAWPAWCSAPLDLKAGASGRSTTSAPTPGSTTSSPSRAGVRADEGAALLTDFFADRR